MQNKNLWRNILFAAALLMAIAAIILLAGCSKQGPNIYGTWVNVQEKGGAAYNYRIEKDGEICAYNYAMFGNNMVCAPYEHDGRTNTTDVMFGERQVWQWYFYGDDTAKIQITTNEGRKAEIVLYKLK